MSEPPPPPNVRYQNLTSFSILAPLLGRERQKPFVSRFAAEGISFLLRKSKDEPLSLFIQHVFSDLLSHSSNTQYQNGISAMFLESCIVSCLIPYYTVIIGLPAL